MYNRSKKESGYTLLELVYVVSIISILLALLVPQLLTQRTRLVMAEAQRKLRTIGSVMTDYALSNQTGNYADFQELKDAHLIQRQVSADNLIHDYSLHVTTSDVGAIGTPRYTIIAYPRPERSYGRLSTFAITEDNVVRVYKPGPGVMLSDPSTWPPIL